MVEPQLMEQIDGTMKRLGIPVEVIDRDTEAVVSNPDHLVIRTAPQIREDTPVVVLGKMCLRVRTPDVVVACDRQLPGAAEILKLCSQAIQGLRVMAMETDLPEEMYRRFLLGTMAPEDCNAVCNKHMFPRLMDRRVLIFHILQMGEERTYNMLREITPMEGGDVLLEMDRNTAVMIRDISSGETLDEAVQFAQALQETLMGETARTMTVGIGNGVTDIMELKDSYREARRAIEVGRTFAPEDYIYAYSHLMLERFLMELPENVAESYLRILFSPRNEKVLSEEIMYTIDTFFRKDLNLSDTARQLYIHRNTLVYRLDKVYRHTGLDLRKFDDAVAFRVFMELKRTRRKEENIR